jgi:autotransporter-associated beta strand protein
MGIQVQGAVIAHGRGHPIGGRSSGRRIPVAAMLLTAAFAAGTGWAASYTATNETELAEYIAEAGLASFNNPTEGSTITIANDIALTSPLTPIFTFFDNSNPGDDFKLTIKGVDGQTPTISGGVQHSIFVVYRGDVEISNLLIQDGLARGGDGADGGGGALGAGGGLFVNEDARVTVDNVRFSNNQAQGGDGGPHISGAAGGGGGGFCEDGQTAQDGGDGGDCLDLLPDLPGDVEEFLRDLFEGGSGGDTGGNGNDFAGGGGGFVGNGGRGGWGGGGGGGGSLGSGGEGGWGGGNGAAGTQGDGGGAFGGAVFVREGGQLQIVNSTVGYTNSVVAGTGSEDGTASGAAIYLDEGVSLIYSIDDPLACVDDPLSCNVGKAIAGEGSLEKTGDGTLTLMGANSYTGITIVTEGELKGNVGGLQYQSADAKFQVEPGATLTLANSAAATVTFKPWISGDGAFRQIGTTTTVTLNNESNDYTGGTEVLGGTVIGTTATIPEDGGLSIAEGATLRLDQSSNADYDVEIHGYGDGFGTFEKSGSGTLLLMGDSSGFAGTTLVSAGALQLANGAILGSSAATTRVTGGNLALESGATLNGDVAISSGARLEGEGTLGSGGTLTLHGTVAPGFDSLQTLHVGGDATFEQGSVFRVQVDASGGTDLLEIAGHAAINGGALVSIEPEDGVYDGASPFTILTADTLSGNFVSPQEFCGLDVGLAAIGSSIQLTLTDLGGSPFANAKCAVTPNQKAVTRSLDEIYYGSGETALVDLYDTARTLTPSQAQSALDSMSGEAFAAFSTTRLANGARLVRTLSQRLRDSSAESSAAGPAYPLGSATPPGPTGMGAFALLGSSVLGSGASHLHSVDTPRAPDEPAFTFVSMRGDSGLGGWLDGYLLLGGVEGSSNSADTEFTIYGTAGGIDYRLTENLLLGVSAAWSRTNLSASSRNTWGHHYTYQGALYGAFSTDHFYLGVIGRYGRSRFSTERYLGFGSIYERPEAHFSGREYSGYAELGIAAFDLAGVQLQPMASFLYTHLYQDGFTESREVDVDSLRLTVEGQKMDSMIGAAGLRLYRSFEMMDGYRIIPELRASYGYEFGDTDRVVNADFADFPELQTGAFEVEGAESGRHMGTIGAGWTVVLNPISSLYFNYDANLASDLFAQSFTIGCLVRW